MASTQIGPAAVRLQAAKKSARSTCRVQPTGRIASCTPNRNKFKAPHPFPEAALGDRTRPRRHGEPDIPRGNDGQCRTKRRAHFGSRITNSPRDPRASTAPRPGTSALITRTLRQNSGPNHGRPTVDTLKRETQRGLACSGHCDWASTRRAGPRPRTPPVCVNAPTTCWQKVIVWTASRRRTGSGSCRRGYRRPVGLVLKRHLF